MFRVLELGREALAALTRDNEEDEGSIYPIEEQNVNVKDEEMPQPVPSEVVQPPEGVFVDAESVPSGERNLGSDSIFVPIRARISDDAEDGEDEIDHETETENEESEDDEGGSIESHESYGSAAERVAVGSSTDFVSPVGSFSAEPYLLSEIDFEVQQNALRQLNALYSGIPSLDMALISNKTEEEFRHNVMDIAVSKGLPLDDENIHNILDALVPLVRARVKSMPVAKPTVEEDDEGSDGHDAADVDEIGSRGSIGSENLENMPLSARGLPIRGVENDQEDQEEPRLRVAQYLSEQELLTVGNEHNVEEKHDVIESLLQPAEQTSGPVVELPAEEGLQEDGEHNFKSDGPTTTDAVEAAIQERIAKEEDDNKQSIQNADQPAEGVIDESPAKENLVLMSSFSDAEGLHDELLLDAIKAGNTAMKDESPSFITGEGEREKDTWPEPSGRHLEYGHPDKSDALLPEVSSNDETMPEDAHPVGLGTDVLPGSPEQGEHAAMVPVDVNAVNDIVDVEKVEEDLCMTGNSNVHINIEGLDQSRDTNKDESKGDSSSELTNGADKGEDESKGDSTVVELTDAPEKREVIEPMEATKNDANSGVDDEEANDGDGESMSEDSSLLSSLVSSKPSEAPAADMPSLGGAGSSLPPRPAGLGRAMPFVELAPRGLRSNGASTPSSTTRNEDVVQSTDSSDPDSASEKLQAIRVKFLRLALRLGQSANNVVVAQVLYRLGLAEQLSGREGRSRASNFERASVLAEELEATGQDDLDFACTIMVLGKSGVGKSATINSLFDEIKSVTDAYGPGTTKVQEIIGTVHGIKLRVIDTPGLLTSFADQRHNAKIMSSVKAYIKKSPPDIVLYIDRLDLQCRDYGDLPLLRSITDTFGSAIWFNAIVVFTHGSTAPPDGPNGLPVSYEMFVAQRSHIVQQTIRQAAGDMRLMNPVSLVENHASCRTNRAGQRVLPNGQVWKPQLLLLCFASKILAEANALLKLQDNGPGKPFATRPRVPPLPFLLSSLLQSRAHLKQPDEPVDDDTDTDEESDSDEEEEYDDLPPFRRLTRAELQLLDKEQRQIYHEELEYRERLYMKKQLKEERARRKEMKRKLAAFSKEVPEYMDQQLEDENASAAVPVPMPDMALPPSFDSDNPTHRYRCLDTSNQMLVRPVLEAHGWDHDSGYDGVNVEKMFLLSKKIPASISGQVTKDKKEATIQMECAASFKNGENQSTLAGLDIQTIGKDVAYTLRGETRFSNFKHNKTICGLAVTMLGDAISAGMKLEDRITIGKRFKLVVNGGALTGRGDVAYGGSLEASLKNKDYPIDQSFSTLGLSVMNWHGDLAIGGNVQMQFKLGKTMVAGRINLNNKGSGQLTIRANSAEQLQMALIGMIPLLRTCFNKIQNSNK